MSPTVTLRPRRLRKLRVHEVSMVSRPANPHAVALLRKADDRAAGLAGRLDALEHGQAMRDAPARLLRSIERMSEQLRAQAEGRRPLHPLPDMAVAKDASGGMRLIAKAVEIAANHRVVRGHEPDTVTLAAKASLSPGQRLIEATRERAAAMRKVG